MSRSSSMENLRLYRKENPKMVATRKYIDNEPLAYTANQERERLFLLYQNRYDELIAEIRKIEAKSQKKKAEELRIIFLKGELNGVRFACNNLGVPMRLLRKLDKEKGLN